MNIRIKCCNCDYVYDPEDAPTKSVLIDSSPYWKHFENYPVCPECGCEDGEEFDQLFEDCSEEDCYGDCENCELKKEHDKEEGGAE